MTALVLAVLMSADGGGIYTLQSDYEWPGSSTSPVEIVNDFDYQVLADGGFPIGSQHLRGYDGGVIVDSKGLYFVRGKNGTPNVWTNIHTWAIGWADTGNGGKYEVCFTPSWSSTLWHDGSNPSWDGAAYLIDVNMVTQHTVTGILGATRPSNIYIRLTGSGSTTLDLDAEWVAGHNYCLSVEWTPTEDAGIQCYSWVRFDDCDQTPVPYCEATTIIGSEESGSGACPSPSPNYITLAQRQYGYDITNLAPTTIHVSALRESTK